jgi:Ca2+-binding EF-hand superfamily protein
MFDDEVAKLNKELERKNKEQREKEARMVDPMQKAREEQLVNKIIEIFIEREITFYDCFQSFYDPLNPQKNTITISQFKKSIRSLNLPLTVQEHRILRRVADPQQIGKVDLQRFCLRFETEDLRLKRLNEVIERVATAFFLQNFNLRRAFSLFDRNGDGVIS